MRALLVVLVLAGCSSPNVPGDLFDPKPNHHFHAASGEVTVIGLAGHVVCFTTDGSEPSEVDGACATGTLLPESNHVALGCDADNSADSLHVIKLAFDWAGQHGVTASGNFLLDCTSPPPDRDGDGVNDDHDNCPVTVNGDQLDTDGDGIGDACEALGAPDADCDGRPDTADNCVSVWNVSQADDDRDGVGNPCDPTPRAAAALPWNNGVLARAFAKWFDEVRCTLNSCQNPSGLGSWSGACDGGGTVAWVISLNGTRGSSVFTWASCQHAVTIDVRDFGSSDPMATKPMSVTLVVDGTFTQDTDFSGNGSESGTVTIGGSFTGSLSSGVVLVNKVRGAGSSYATACSTGPQAEEMCAPNNASVRYVFPDWSCSPGACPAPVAALVDGDGDGVFDPFDDCPTTPNANQSNVDFDGEGDACDATPGVCAGVPDGGLPPLDAGVELDGGLPDAGAPFVALELKLGRCLYDDGAGNVRSARPCDVSALEQRWDVFAAGNGKSFRNQKTQKCLVAQTWAGTIGMSPCGGADAEWLTQRYDQGGFDSNFPMRFRSATQNYCLYSDHTGLVYATQGNCDLLGTQDNRKLGIYADGDFSVAPLQP